MKKFYSFLVAMLLSVVAFAYDVKIDGIYYNLDEENKTAEVTCENLGEEGNYLGVTSIVIPVKITYNGVVYSVTSIGICAFSNCISLISIEIPSSVTSISHAAFNGCSSLTSIEIPSSVTSIGTESVFSNCSSLTSINVDKNNPNYTSDEGVLYDKNITTLICCPGSKTEVIIPNSITSIGDYAFEGCSSLTSIEIPNNVTSIGDYAFEGCSSLTLIEIPNNVTSIGGYAFYECLSLTSIIMQGLTPPAIEDDTFEEVPSGIEIKVPCGSINSYKTAEYWKGFVNYIENIFVLTVVSNDNSMGFATVTKPNICTDDVAQVQAQALAGYEFVRWSDGATENPHILLVTEDMIITAEFRKIGEEPEDKPGEEEKHNNFIVESADKTQGAVEITITAKAIEGFEFDHWSDGSTENPRIVTLDADVELYAYFKASTDVENSRITSAVVYSNNGVLHVEGAETDYHVLDAAGRLVYSGSVAALALPRGVYVVVVEGEAQKVVL